MRRDQILYFTCRNLYTIRHAFFSYRGGISTGDFESLNCAWADPIPGRIVDNPEHVLKNRQMAHVAFMREHLVRETPLVLLRQTHSTHVVVAEDASVHGQEGDALITTNPRVVIGVYTADCVPVVVCDTQHRAAAIMHVGWKGALAGIVNATMSEMRRQGFDPKYLQAGLGPAMQQMSYEVDHDFRDRFVQQDSTYAEFFKEGSTEDKLLFNLPKLVAAQLNQEGVLDVGICPYDTYSQADLFFSNRRALHNKRPAFGSQVSMISLGAGGY